MGPGHDDPQRPGSHSTNGQRPPGLPIGVLAAPPAVIAGSLLFDPGYFIPPVWLMVLASGVSAGWIDLRRRRRRTTPQVAATIWILSAFLALGAVVGALRGLV